MGTLTRAAAYLPWTTSVIADPPERYEPIGVWLPPASWSWVWLAVGVLLLASLVWRRLTRTAMSLLTGMLTLWGVGSLAAWITANSLRSWVTGSMFIMVAVWAGVFTVLLERRRGPDG